MKRYGKVISCKTKKRWAVQTLVLSVSLSLMFGFLSQTFLTSMGIIVATITICFFIAISVIFDMIGIAVAGAEEEQFIKWQAEGIKGAKVGLKLCFNSEKVCSFCADVVGDICSTLCGAGGACIVVALSSRLTNPSLVSLVSVSISAVIAGATIFFKALCKERALTKSNQIILSIGKLLENTLFRSRGKS